MKSLSLTVQKLQRRLKLTTDKQTDRQTDNQTDRQTGQEQHAPDHSIRGIKIHGFEPTTLWLSHWQTDMLPLGYKNDWWWVFKSNIYTCPISSTHCHIKLVQCVLSCFATVNSQITSALAKQQKHADIYFVWNFSMIDLILLKLHRDIPLLVIRSVTDVLRANSKFVKFVEVRPQAVTGILVEASWR